MSTRVGQEIGEADMTNEIFRLVVQQMLTMLLRESAYRKENAIFDAICRAKNEIIRAHEMTNNRGDAAEGGQQ